MNQPALQHTRFTIHSVQEMHRLASRIAGRLRRGAVVGLSGPLGAGKTEFVRGFARSLGVHEEVSSPSFVLEAVYEVQHDTLDALHHWDLFRITSGELECEIAEHQGDSARLTLIEWPERVAWIDDLLDLKILISLAGLGSAHAAGAPEIGTAAARSADQALAGAGGVREVEILEITPTTLAGAIEF